MCARVLVALAVALLVVGAWPIGPEPVAEAKGKAASQECRVQKPQRFLERRTFVRKGAVDPARHAKALRWLTDRYGSLAESAPGLQNMDAPFSHAETVQFFGLPVSVHEKIAPALACVEKRIRKTCKGRSHYTPRAVGGFRTSNTYRGPEVSNHLFGLAIDIDPERNPCCGCVDPWPTNPLCREPAATVYDRTALPKCWVKAFERYGFDWLGHDDLEDTMHFEFLGDPDRIKVK
jgi:hypothetical protein